MGDTLTSLLPASSHKVCVPLVLGRQLHIVAVEGCEIGIRIRHAVIGAATHLVGLRLSEIAGRHSLAHTPEPVVIGDVISRPVWRDALGKACEKEAVEPEERTFDHDADKAFLHAVELAAIAELVNVREGLDETVAREETPAVVRAVERKDIDIHPDGRVTILFSDLKNFGAPV